MQWTTRLHSCINPANEETVAPSLADVFRNFNHEIITQLRIKPHSNHLYTSTAKNQSSATSHEDLVFNMSAFTIALEHKIALIWAWPVSNTNSNRSSSTLTPYLIGFSETPTVTRASRSLKSPNDGPPDFVEITSWDLGPWGSPVDGWLKSGKLTS